MLDFYTYVCYNLSIERRWKRMGKKKKPKDKLEITRTVLEMLAYIAAIVGVIYEIAKG